MLQMPSFPMLCEARHTLHFGLLRTRVKRSPGCVLPRAAVDGGNIKNNQLIAQQVRCCVLLGNALRKALMLPQFANEMLRFCMSLTCQITMTIQGQCWSMSQDFCAPPPSWCLEGPKRSIKEEHGSVHLCDGNKQQRKRLG